LLLLTFLRSRIAIFRPARLPYCTLCACVRIIIFVRRRTVCFYRPLQFVTDCKLLLMHRGGRQQYLPLVVVQAHAPLLIVVGIFFSAYKQNEPLEPHRHPRLSLHWSCSNYEFAFVFVFTRVRRQRAFTESSLV